MTITFVVASFLDGTSRYSDGSEWPNPFVDAPDDVCELAEAIQPRFVELLGGLASRISAAGAPVDPTDPAVLLALAQLVLLRIDLLRPPDQLVEDLNIWPPGSVDREAAAAGHLATTSSRHGRNARFQALLAAFAETVAHQTGPLAIRPPYAGGGKRATRGDTAALRRALAVLIAQDPSLTPSSLLGLVRGGDHPALAKLRKALGVDEDWMPDQRRLERLWPKTRH
jgi:hypothetical protein